MTAPLHLPIDGDENAPCFYRNGVCGVTYRMHPLLLDDHEWVPRRAAVESPDQPEPGTYRDSDGGQLVVPDQPEGQR